MTDIDPAAVKAKHVGDGLEPVEYSDSRCARSRGHKGPHWFATPLGLMPLVVNQK